MSGGRPQHRPQNGLGGLTDATRAMSQIRWPYSHPPRGTCVPGCELYGRCHCGCGDKPTIAKQSLTRDGAVLRRPWVFRKGHNRKVFRDSKGTWSKHGVPAEKVRPLVEWLRKRYGGRDQLAILAGLHRSTINDILYGRRKGNVTPDTARRIYLLFNRLTDVSLPPLVADEKDAHRAWSTRKAEVQIDRAYNTIATIREREERMAKAKRIERKRLSIKELVG